MAFVITAIFAVIGLIVVLAQYGNFYEKYVADKSGDAAAMFSASSVIGLVVLNVLILAIVACICLGVFFGKALSKVLRDPIDELKGAAQKLKSGDLDTDITYESKDELGDLADNFREACSQMKTVVDDASGLLEQMSDGNFSADTQVEEEYVGDFTALLTSMRKMSSQLSETLDSIRESSEQVEIGAQQLSESAQALAEGATDQAASIQELTATVENVTSISEESAETAEMAAQGMSKAEAEARGSREDMQELTAAMGRISETSKQIEEIIGAIEDIASQTNLLALNASIEAARAGEAGRGFAVVADQIGKLAADSAKSAVNTRELISKSLAEIEHGNEITNKTAIAIDKVVANMTEFAAAAKGSAEASRNQADMLKQVEYGIEQISGVVQNNSATAEETSAVSQELLAQAETLKNQVSQFTLKV
ncbi:MAG: HAMP domain-containing protein [Lachnospiraceae bacterium]|nr:HAMP domain-containing protein [Lachnospiraceae bacterium]